MSGFLGGAELSGNIDIARKDVFSKAPEGMRARADAYLQYQVCIIILSDKELPTTKKIDELITVRQSFEKPVK